MNKKILVICDILEAKRRMVRFLWDYIEELSRRSNVKLYGTGCKGFKMNMDIKEIINKLYGNDYPDLIYLDDDKYCEGFIVKGLENIDIPKATFIEDTRIEKDFRCKLINENKIKYVFVVIEQDLPYYKKRCTYSKFILRHHCANTDIFKDYGYKKEYDILLYGCIANIYPLRKKIKRALQEQKEISYKIIDHPGYWKKGELPKIDEIYTDKRLAKEINKSWIAIATKSKYNYLLTKYFEIPACNTLIAGDMPRLGEKIFKNNYIVLDKKFSDEKIIKILKEHLKDKKKIIKMTNTLYEDIRLKHSTKSEVDRLLDNLRYAQ